MVWNCKFCTFENEDRQRMCQACESFQTQEKPTGYQDKFGAPKKSTSKRKSNTSTGSRSTSTKSKTSSTSTKKRQSKNISADDSNNDSSDNESDDDLSDIDAKTPKKRTKATKTTKVVPSSDQKSNKAPTKARAATRAQNHAETDEDSNSSSDQSDDDDEEEEEEKVVKSKVTRKKSFLPTPPSTPQQPKRSTRHVKQEHRDSDDENIEHLNLNDTGKSNQVDGDKGDDDNSEEIVPKRRGRKPAADKTPTTTTTTPTTSKVTKTASATVKKSPSSNIDDTTSTTTVTDKSKAPTAKATNKTTDLNLDENNNNNDQDDNEDEAKTVPKKRGRPKSIISTSPAPKPTTPQQNNNNDQDDDNNKNDSEDDNRTDLTPTSTPNRSMNIPKTSSTNAVIQVANMADLDDPNESIPDLEQANDNSDEDTKSTTSTTTTTTTTPVTKTISKSKKQLQEEMNDSDDNDRDININKRQKTNIATKSTKSNPKPNVKSTKMTDRSEDDNDDHDIDEKDDDLFDSPNPKDKNNNKGSKSLLSTKISQPPPSSKKSPLPPPQQQQQISSLDNNQGDSDESFHLDDEDDDGRITTPKQPTKLTTTILRTPLSKLKSTNQLSTSPQSIQQQQQQPPQIIHIPLLPPIPYQQYQSHCTPTTFHRIINNPQIEPLLHRFPVTILDTIPTFADKLQHSLFLTYLHNGLFQQKLQYMNQDSNFILPTIEINNNDQSMNDNFDDMSDELMKLQMDFLQLEPNFNEIDELGHLDEQNEQNIFHHKNVFQLMSLYQSYRQSVTSFQTTLPQIQTTISTTALTTDLNNDIQPQTQDQLHNPRSIFDQAPLYDVVSQLLQLTSPNSLMDATTLSPTTTTTTSSSQSQSHIDPLRQQDQLLLRELNRAFTLLCNSKIQHQQFLNRTTLQLDPNHKDIFYDQIDSFQCNINPPLDSPSSLFFAIPERQYHYDPSLTSLILKTQIELLNQHDTTASTKSSKKQQSKLLFNGYFGDELKHITTFNNKTRTIHNINPSLIPESLYPGQMIGLSDLYTNITKDEYSWSLSESLPTYDFLLDILPLKEDICRKLQAKFKKEFYKVYREEYDTFKNELEEQGVDADGNELTEEIITQLTHEHFEQDLEIFVQNQLLPWVQKRFCTTPQPNNSIQLLNLDHNNDDNQQNDDENASRYNFFEDDFTHSQLQLLTTSSLSTNTIQYLQHISNNDTNNNNDYSHPIELLPKRYPLSQLQHLTPVSPIHPHVVPIKYKVLVYHNNLYPSNDTNNPIQHGIEVEQVLNYTTRQWIDMVQHFPPLSYDDAIIIKYNFINTKHLNQLFLNLAPYLAAKNIHVFPTHYSTFFQPVSEDTTKQDKDDSNPSTTTTTTKKRPLVHMDTPCTYWIYDEPRHTERKLFAVANGTKLVQTHWFFLSIMAGYLLPIDYIQYNAKILSMSSTQIVPNESSSSQSSQSSTITTVRKTNSVSSSRISSQISLSTPSTQTQSQSMNSDDGAEYYLNRANDGIINYMFSCGSINSPIAPNLNRLPSETIMRLLQKDTFTSVNVILQRFQDVITQLYTQLNNNPKLMNNPQYIQCVDLLRQYGFSSEFIPKLTTTSKTTSKTNLTPIIPTLPKLLPISLSLSPHKLPFQSLLFQNSCWFVLDGGELSTTNHYFYSSNHIGQLTRSIIKAAGGIVLDLGDFIEMLICGFVDKGSIDSTASTTTAPTTTTKGKNNTKQQKSTTTTTMGDDDNNNNNNTKFHQEHYLSHFLNSNYFDQYQTFINPNTITFYDQDKVLEKQIPALIQNNIQFSMNWKYLQYKFNIQNGSQSLQLHQDSLPKFIQSYEKRIHNVQTKPFDDDNQDHEDVNSSPYFRQYPTSETITQVYNNVYQNFPFKYFPLTIISPIDSKRQPASSINPIYNFFIDTLIPYALQHKQHIYMNINTQLHFHLQQINPNLFKPIPIPSDEQLISYLLLSMTRLPYLTPQPLFESILFGFTPQPSKKSPPTDIPCYPQFPQRVKTHHLEQLGENFIP